MSRRSTVAFLGAAGAFALYVATLADAFLVGGAVSFALGWFWRDQAQAGDQ